MAVPPLTAYPDADLDVLQGEAPPGTEMKIDLFAGPLNSGYDTDFSSGTPRYTHLASSALDGTYNVDLSAHGLYAGNYGVVTVTAAVSFSCEIDAVSGNPRPRPLSRILTGGGTSGSVNCPSAQSAWIDRP